MEDVLKPTGSLLATDRSKAVVLMYLLNVFGVGVSCRNLYSFVVYLYVSGSGSISSVGKERANFSAVTVVYLLLFGFCLERLHIPLAAWEGLHYFIVALPEFFL